MCNFLFSQRLQLRSLKHPILGDSRKENHSFHRPRLAKSKRLGINVEGVGGRENDENNK